VANLNIGYSTAPIQQISSHDRNHQKNFPVCQFLEWDSSFFGYRIAKTTSSKLDTKTIKNILKWSKTNQIDCLYFLADSEDNATINVAEENKFHFVDIRMRFERQLKGSSTELNTAFVGDIRPSCPRDIPFLRDIARTSYRDTRFYYDSHFPAHLADKLYETWIEKSCVGYADVVLIAEVEGDVVGYISCHLHDSFRGQIGTRWSPRRLERKKNRSSIGKQVSALVRRARGNQN